MRRYDIKFMLLLVFKEPGCVGDPGSVSMDPAIWLDDILYLRVAKMADPGNLHRKVSLLIT
jgi:hypothetical protein